MPGAATFWGHKGLLYSSCITFDGNTVKQPNISVVVANKEKNMVHTNNLIESESHSHDVYIYMHILHAYTYICIYTGKLHETIETYIYMCFYQQLYLSICIICWLWAPLSNSDLFPLWFWAPSDLGIARCLSNSDHQDWWFFTRESL